MAAQVQDDTYCYRMEAAVLTLAFDPERKTFPSEELEDFCLNKQVYGIESQFFQHENIPYWTVLVRFATHLVSLRGHRSNPLNCEKLFVAQEIASLRSQ